jgi:2-C-methyl-D-erythritol 4-phosphate cytidylyltransferase/2-C-methyl-D-erythritol 2,4-cyclodiphosphate synthase
MSSRARTVALLVAAGSGSRAGGELPKQYARIGGQPMIALSLRTLAEHPAVDEVIIVIADDHQAHLRDALGDVRHVTGGATRRQSVWNGLEALRSGPPNRILVHDAARPFLPAAVIDRVLEPLGDHSGATPGLAVADTLVRADGVIGDVVPREHLYRVQTPQAFRFDDLVAAHLAWNGQVEPTDDAQMVRAAGSMVAMVAGDPMLEKITYPQDFTRAEQMVSARMSVRTGLGFDVHALAEGEELWLGGLRIPHDKGLRGHSDADVVLHALTDALLGAAGEGDIGQHFPPSEARWRGAPSSLFLEHAAEIIRLKGGRIEHADVTVICEAPKIGPHRNSMRARIAELLALPLARISVKATTTERLGFTGRGEGIAAQAIATIRLPELA